jgi:hypothetical protein
MTRQITLAILLGIITIFTLNTTTQAKEGEWIKLFNGKNLDGWKVTKENPDSFKVVDGAIVANGPRAHLFYKADKPLVDFEFEAKVMTTKGSNAGIYFHTQYQDSGWPKHGYEAQVNATHGDPKKSGSLYGVVNVNPAPHKDDVWFKYNIKVKGKRIIITIDDKVTVDYTEPKDKKAGKSFTRILTKGTFGIQAHDPKSKAMFKDLRVRRLD